MSAINSINNNGNNVYEKLKINKTEKAEKKEETVQLSKTAQEYLQQLKQKYNNVDFIIADFSSDEEAQQHLNSGKGEYNCVITPETLEKMATNEEERAKFEGIIENAITDLSGIKEKLGDDAEKVESYGISVDSEGNVSYYALLKEGLKKDDRVEKAREKSREKKAEEAEKKEKAEFKERLVKASTIEELIELIKGKNEEGSKDRIEIGKNNDEALKIDRLDFGKKQENVVDEYIPTAAPAEKHPFDFKA
ncbi:MAG: hypothetical protein E7490_02785 [Ruminococcaceae bacterium]|nr:hypothetical protein [Oscillospiraceae bacterium]